MTTAIKKVKSKLKNNGATGITVWDFPVGFALAARIKDLRDSGKVIITKTEVNTNNNGNHARYILVK